MVNVMDQDDIEQAIRLARESGDKAAVSATLLHYGPEVLAFIQDRVGNESDADDVFADFAENLWNSFARFRGECSVRTWSYVIARRAISRHRREQRARRERASASELEHGSAVAAEVRSRTAPFLLTETKSEARRLRESMPDEDQQLLLLRLERNLSFRDIALVLADVDDLPDAELTREAARLRKRFQLAKERLGELLVNAGLIRSE
jgi:RNA polymerase sigma-70 factor (ECF subfamily)